MKISKLVFSLSVLVLISCNENSSSSDQSEANVAIASIAKKEALKVEGMPKPIGPYSPAVKSGDFLFLSGQIGKNPDSGNLVEGGVADEVDQIMKNIARLLEADGIDFSNVVQSQVFLKNIEDYSAMNEVYARYFEGVIPPARAAVEVADLPGGASVEIMMTARH